MLASTHARRLNASVNADSIRPAFDSWSLLNDRLTDAVHSLSDDELNYSTGEGRWPLWAVVGHAACQRVFWLCDFCGEPGAATTPFTSAIWSCPGDEDLENPLNAAQLVEALTSTFAIVDRVISTWRLDQLSDELSQPEWGEDWVHTRGSVIQRVYSHDVWHASEASEILTRHGLPAIEIWP
jgi:uncharacterized damage-inducible protein DinB